MTTPIQYSADNPFAPKTKSPIYSSDNPFAPSQLDQGKKPSPTQVEPDSPWTSIGNSLKYLYQLKGTEGMLSEPKAKLKQDIIQTGQALGGNLSVFSKKVGDFLTESDLQRQMDLGSGVIGAVSSIGNSVTQHGLIGSVGNAIGSVGAGIISIPVNLASTLTGTKVGPDGNVLPTTPQEYSQSLQQTIALIATAGVASKVASVMTPGADALMGINSLSYPGALVKAAIPSIASGLASGAAYGSIAHAGEENQLSATIGDMLAFGGLGAVHGALFETKLLLNKIIENKANIDASTVAAARTMQISPEDSPEDIAAKTKAFATSHDGISAAIDSRVSVGKSIVLKDIPEDVVNSIVAKYMPSSRASEGIIRFDPETQTKINDTPVTLKGNKNVNVNVIDPFDKISILSQSNPDLMEELKKSTGLTNDEIQSHSKYVKKQINDLSIDPNNLTKVDPNTLADRAKTILDDSKAKLANLKDGDKINGFAKIGNNITNGKQTFQINSPEAVQAVSDLKSINSNELTLNLPKQNFSPDFGRELMKGTSVYKGPNGELLVTPSPWAGTPLDIFQSSGYVPNELVTFAGKPGLVNGLTEEGNLNVTDLTTGKKRSIFPSEVTRTGNGIDSEFYPASNGEQITRMGTLNPDSYFDSLYSQFSKSHLNLDSPPDEPFSKTILRFATDQGIKNQGDISTLGKSFMSRMVNDVLGDMDEDIKDKYNKAIKNQQDLESSQANNKIAQLHNTLINQNMSLTHRGGGLYDIKDVSDGKILASIRSLDDAQKFLGLSNQAIGYDLDGGSSNGQPTFGTALSQVFTPSSNRLANWLDAKVNVKFAREAANTRPAVAAMDQLSGTNFTPHVQALAIAQNYLANIHNSPLLKSLISNTDNLIEAGRDVDYDRRIAINESLSRLSSKDAISRFKLQPDDIQLASQVAKAGSGSVNDFMNAVNEEANYQKIKSDRHNTALKQITKEEKYSPEAINMGTKLFGLSDGSPKLVGVIKLAENLEHGEANDINLNGKERNLVTKFNDLANNVPGISDPIFTNINYSKLAEQVGHNPFTSYSPEFLRNVNKIGSTPGNQVEMDPLVSAHNFRLAAIRSAQVIPEGAAYLGADGKRMLSMNNIIDAAQQNINSYLPKVSDDKIIGIRKKNQITPAQFFQNHLDNVKGIPDMGEQLGKAAQNMLSNVYGKTVNDNDLIRFGNALTYSALLSARPAFAIRDLTNAWQNIAIYDSYKDAIQVMGRTFKVKDGLDLVNNGEIALQGKYEMLNPNEDIIEGMGRLAGLVKVSGKLSDLATKVNGQQLAHFHATVATYMHYYDKVGKLSGDMIKNDISKADAYNELKIAKLKPVEQKGFDDLISAGKTEAAGKYLARIMADEMNSTFGRNNAPQAWRSIFGRLAGGFGSWATHQINTSIDQYARGTRRQILESWVKGFTTNAAIIATAYATGTNLNGWMINPLSIPAGSPLINGIIGTVHDKDNMWSTDPAIRNPAGMGIAKLIPGLGHNKNGFTYGQGNWAHLYLPMSYAAQGLLDSYNMMQGDFGVTSLTNAAGVASNRNERSPLQQSMGNFPNWKGRSLPNAKLPFGIGGP